VPEPLGKACRYRGPRRLLRPLLLYLLLLAGAAPVMVPFLWMVSNSLKTREQAGEYPPEWLPLKEEAYWDLTLAHIPVVVLSEGKDGRTRVRLPDGMTRVVPSSEIKRPRHVRPQWSNYSKLLEVRGGSSDDDFPRFLLKTLLIAGLSVIGQVLASSLVGWGFARLRFAGKEALFLIMLATMMIPGQIAMIPTFILFRWLGWIDTFLPLIVPAWFGSAFFIFLYRQFYLTVPLEMDEAATVDGCTPLRTYWSILMPLARPVTVTVGVFTFLGAWNDFLGPLIYINSDHKRTLSLALAKFQGAYATDIPALMAAATLMLLPVLALYFVSQRALMRGMIVTGVKG